MTAPYVYPRHKKYGVDHGIFVDLQPLYHTTTEIAFQRPPVTIKESKESYAKIRAKRCFLSMGKWAPGSEEIEERLSSTYRDSYVPLTNLDFEGKLYVLPRSLLPDPLSRPTTYRPSPASLPPAGKHLTDVLPPGKKTHPTLRKPLPLLVARSERAPVALYPRDEEVLESIPAQPAPPPAADGDVVVTELGVEETDEDGQPIHPLHHAKHPHAADPPAPVPRLPRGHLSGEEVLCTSQSLFHTLAGSEERQAAGRRSRPGSATLKPINRAAGEDGGGGGGGGPKVVKPPQLFVPKGTKLSAVVIDATFHRKRAGFVGRSGELSAAWKDHIDTLNGEVVSRIGNRSTLYAQSPSEMKRNFPDAGPVVSFTKLPPLSVTS
ncbi:hypothetical protein HDU96_000640 [Phlyctochytrium bullatum]|nr:hypothetical protein HDU96_000640 [Phlyctochytrium bullatum]